MPRAKKHSAEEIIPKLRAAELEIAKGRTAAEAAKKIGVIVFASCEFQASMLVLLYLFSIR